MNHEYESSLGVTIHYNSTPDDVEITHVMAGSMNVWWKEYIVVAFAYSHYLLFTLRAGVRPLDMTLRFTIIPAKVYNMLVCTFLKSWWPFPHFLFLVYAIG